MPSFMAFKYLFSCFFTTGNKKYNPTILGNTIAKIMASEKAQIEFILAAAPIITNNKKVVYTLSLLLCLFQINTSKTAVHNKTMKSWLKQQITLQQL